MLRWALGGVLASGCTVATVDVPLDFDEDGLVDEEAYGSDPYEPDTDGDGFLDGFEVEQERDPLDPGNHPYTGGWLIDTECNDEIVGSGTGLGDVAEDFVLVDQYGEDFRFHDFCDRAALLELSGFT
jgi:hypothetical protein